MVSKSLEKTVHITPYSISAEIDYAIKLEYYLVESESDEEFEVDYDSVFGFEIVKKVNDMQIESKLIRNYSHSKGNATGILKILAENTVTPVSLPFIIDDIIGC